MTAPQTDATTDPQSIIAALQQRLDAALAREAALAEELAARTAELAERKSEFGERIEHQAATIDVLKVMSASPGDPQPVFDLIVRRATELCNGLRRGLVRIRWRDWSTSGPVVSQRHRDTAAHAAYAATFPSGANSRGPSHAGRSWIERLFTFGTRTPTSNYHRWHANSSKRCLGHRYRSH